MGTTAGCNYLVRERNMSVSIRAFSKTARSGVRIGGSFFLSGV